MKKLNNIVRSQGRKADRRRGGEVASLLLLLLMITACSTQQVAKVEQADKVHTVYVPNANVTLTWEEQTLSSNVTFYTTMDSLVIASVRPFMGVELFRLEATPTELIIFDKTAMEYTSLTYQSLLSLFSVPISYTDIQDIATGKNKLTFLDITYSKIQTNVPVNKTRLPLACYSYKSIEQVLQ